MRTSLTVFLLTCCFICLYADGVQPSGSGTSSDPYVVVSLDNLLWISTNPDSWDCSFIQKADIDASETSTWNNDEGFYPIGNSTVSFTGYYDGNKHCISGLYINRPEEIRQAFFGTASDGEIRGLSMIDVSIVGANSSAALIGYCSDACYATNCYSSGTVTGYIGATGGLVGYLRNDAVVQSCGSSVDVSGEEWVGGLVGYTRFGSTIRNSYCIGSVHGNSYVGGITGWLEDSQVDKCYSVGLVECVVTGGGGLIGLSTDSYVNDSFWDKQTSCYVTSYGGTGKTTAEMQDVATYTYLDTDGLEEPWDFYGDPYDDEGNADIWDIDSDINGGYPYLTDIMLSSNEGTIPAVLGDIVLQSIYPNPFNPATTICFSVNSGQNALLAIYNVQGRLVHSWPVFAAGGHSVVWNGTDDRGRAVASGMYFCRLQSGSTQQTRKMLLLK